MNANNNAGDGGAIHLLGNNATSNGFPSGGIQFISGGASSSNDAFAFLQFNNGGYDPSVKILKNGNVGIGLSSSSDFVSKLTINGDLGFKSGSAFRNIFGAAPNAGLLLSASTGASDGATIQLAGNSSAPTGIPSGTIRFISGGSASSAEAFRFLQYNGGNYTPSLVIQKNGKVAIGEAYNHTNTSTDYKLYVQTGILTERVKVALINDPSNWADFVFDEDYRLAPLSEVEAYITSNKHLPEIPSTNEVHTNGLDLAQMDAKLLQKIEELTLYIIQQQKEINVLKAKVK